MSMALPAEAQSRGAVRMAIGGGARGDHPQAVQFLWKPARSSPAHTTSIPEAPSSKRNWDYRYCWLRDAYFVVDALGPARRHLHTMESYINYITTIAIDGKDMRPVHSIVPFSSLEETMAPHPKGSLGSGLACLQLGSQTRPRTTSMAAVAPSCL